MNLEVEGRHALLFDDDTSAAFVNSREALVPWNGDESLLIDRYDVRHLLDRIPARPPPRHHLGRIEDPVAVSQSELDLQRYLDLPSPDDDDDGRDRSDSFSATLGSEATSAGAYQAVPFSYGNAESVIDPNNIAFGLNSSGFNPPFPVPKALVNNLPPSEKLHQIIARTAIFVSEHGGQSEIVLRVKQGDNPTFGFLMPDHHLHAYFRYLVDHPQVLKAEPNSGGTQEEKKLDNQENESDVAAGGALSMLGSVYGSGEDDDAAPPADSKEIDPGKTNIAVSASISNRLEKIEAYISAVLKDKEIIKGSVASAFKEKTSSSTKNHSANAASASATRSKKIRDEDALLPSAMERPQSSQLGRSDVKPLILEPPSPVKGTIDKIVEFVLRNGKEFEAILIAQDKATGRFPFLLPSNQYHSYYLKVLDEAREPKLAAKKAPNNKHEAGNKSKKQEAPGKDQSEGSAIDPQRKEKFKMIIGGGPKKDPTPTRHSGMSADEAAAIVLAATRGGLSPANEFVPSDNNSGRACSFGSIGKPVGGTDGDVSVAKAVAETIALVASNEADSSEAYMTKEQKLKAERLKRAKMFVAMIKKGTDGSSVAVDAEMPDRTKNLRSRSTDHDGREDDDSRKKRRSSHRHRHHRKHHSSSEDEPRVRKSSRTRRRHEDEHHEGDGKAKAPDYHREVEIAAGSDATEVPSDFRAKIRAMLLETL